MNENAIKLINNEMQLSGKDTKRAEWLTRLEGRRITPEKEIPPMEFLFRMFCKPCFPRGELVAVAGKAKSGKTFISSILMSLCFRREVLTIQRIEQRQLRVLWYDTEQSEESTQDILKKRIMPMIAGTSSQPELFPETLPFPQESFHVFNVRGEFWEERLPMLEAAMQEYQPDLVILDGIRDLVNDINDGVMAQNVIERLMHLASELRCCIVCVLHQNKSLEDKNLRGWIGTELKNKSFEVYECVKDSDRVFTCKQTDTRKYDIVDKLEYVVNEYGIPTIRTSEPVSALSPANKPNTPTEGRPPINPYYVDHYDGTHPVIHVDRLFRQALNGYGKLTDESLRTRVMEVSHITTFALYCNCRNRAINENIITKTIADDGRTLYSLSQQQQQLLQQQKQQTVNTTSPTGE